MIKINFTLLCSCVVLCTYLSPTYAQNTNWVELMQEDNANFFDIQAAFNAAFENVPQSERKGTGWKQFKRWEYYHSLRVDEQGKFPAPGHVLSEMENYYQAHTEAKSYVSGSGNWSALGPVQLPTNITGQPNGNGRLTCITFHPTDPNTIFVGAPSGGFWKTTDGGANWTQNVTGLTRLGISSIVVDPSNVNTIYIGTGDRDGGDAPGYGVWRSIDGGLTWAAHNNGMGNRTVYEILMNPNNPNNMIASTNGNRIYRTTDGGANWTFSSTSSAMKDIAFKPGDPNTIYASGTTFDVSTNGGASFTRITSGVPSAQRIALAVSAADPNRVYLLAGNGSGLVGLYQSTNSGTSFTARSTSPNILGYSETGADNNSQAWYDLVLAADPTNADIIYAGGINIWKSTNAGSNWSIVAHWVGSGGTADVHADHHVLEFSPHNSNLYNGNDGGIYFTPDGGANWSEITSGLAIAQIYKIGVAQTNPEIVINGYQDNGTGLYFDGSWYTIVGGDGMECIVDPTDDNYVYTALYYGDIRRSTSGGNGFARIADNGVNGITESGDWVTPYKLDPTNPARMFIGYSNIWRSDDVKNPGSNAIVWDQISSFTGTSSIRDLAIAPSSNDVMYVARNRNGERFLRTTNLTAANPTWTNLHSSLPFNSTPKDIEIDPADPNHVYIAIGNSVYESTNAGSNWTNISGTLPNISANTLVIDPESPVGAIYVGMDVGVYYRDNTMSDWVMYATGLPSVEVTELEIHSNGTNCRSQIFAATYGQGLWTGDLKDPGNTAPVACFEADQTNVCQGQPILFTSYSDYTPTGWTWSISPNTFTYQGGTNANSENPQISFNAPGTYTISLDASNGIGSDNETKSAYITVSSASNANTFSDDFESYPTCATTTNCGTGTCAITGNWNNLNNGTDDDIDWRVDAGGTPSTNTGPNTDFNPGNASGNYAYTEASNCFGATAILESSCILMDQNYNFQFAYHMSGANMGTIHLDINTSGTWIEDFVTPLSGDQGTAWQTRTIDMSAYTGQTISLRLRGITGSAFESDLAIDDLQFLPITTLNTQIKSFYANCETGGKNELQLTVDNVTQGSSLRIERLNNKTQTWEIFEEIELKKEITSYIIEDNNPALGDNYYRLLSNNAQQETQILQTTVSQCSFDEHTLNVFPNPFEKGFSIQMHSGYNGTLAYSLQNLLGQQLRQGTFSLEEGLNTFEVNFEDLPQGVYLLHLGDSNPQIIKMVKQH